MSLQIYVAHTGEQLECFPSYDSPSPLEDLARQLHELTQIAPQDQVLLTTKGKQVRSQTPYTESELYLFDRALFTRDASRETKDTAPRIDVNPISEFPSDLEDQKSLRAWQILFENRRGWAIDVQQRCEVLCQQAEEVLVRRQIIDHALRIASSNLDARVRNLDQKMRGVREWYQELSEEMSCEPAAVSDRLDLLGELPAKAWSRKYMRLGAIANETWVDNQGAETVTLRDLVNVRKVQKAAKDAQRSLEAATAQIESSELAVAQVTSRVQALREEMGNKAVSQSQDDMQEPAKLQQEVNVTVTKIVADCDRIAALRNNEAKALTTTSKVALLHTKNFLPAIRDYSQEMADLVQLFLEQHRHAVSRLSEGLQAVAQIEVAVAAASKNIAEIQLSDSGRIASESVTLAIGLPFTYGAILAEALRRQLWTEKMKHDAASLAEELAVYQDDEQKRRKKWLKDVAYVTEDGFNTAALGVDINVAGQQDAPLDISQADVDTYLASLRRHEPLAKTSRDLEDLIRTAEKRSRDPSKRTKAFRTSSVHEAGLGKGSLMLRGDTEARTLRDANTKLEEELKNYRSRVRRLEDLVHRQTQISRAPVFSEGSLNQPTMPWEPPSRETPASFTPSSYIRPGLESRSSRRLSVQSQQTEDPGLLHRISQLEVDLASEREAKTMLQEERAGYEIRARREIEEANSTKKDLMENMEAQQKEFAMERRSLEDELERHKMRLDELEDEMDRVAGSRDHERTGLEQRMQALATDLDQARNSGGRDTQKLQEQLVKRDAAIKQRNAKFARLCNILAAEEAVPETSQLLVEKVEQLALDTVERVRALTEDMKALHAEHDRTMASLSNAQAKTSSLEVQAVEVSEWTQNLIQQLDAEKSKSKSLTEQLDGAQSLLADVQAKYADGETGSQSLQAKLASQGAKVTSLSVELAEIRAQQAVNDNELISLRSANGNLRETTDEQRRRLEKRAEYLNIGMKRLARQTHRSRRLLEYLGFSISYDEHGQMIVQRASKLALTTSQGPISGMERRASLSASLEKDQPPERIAHLTMNLGSGGQTMTLEEEEQLLRDLLKELDTFDLDLCSESIAKRMRDVEHTARKWQKEARSYRDKAHKYHSEAQEKIAFRSFKEGDLALFLPTRNQVNRPWAAFNVGAPHYFLREQETHRLVHKEWLVARITKVQERTVNLSTSSLKPPPASSHGKANGNAREGSEKAAANARGEDGRNHDDDNNDNPFDLSDGLRWYLIDAAEEKPGAPSTPGLGKASVASTNIDAKGSIRMSKGKPGQAVEEVNRQLSKSLESRRSSNTSKRSAQGILGLGLGGAGGGGGGSNGGNGGRPSSKASSDRRSTAAATVGTTAGDRTPLDEGRGDLLFGP